MMGQINPSSALWLILKLEHISWYDITNLNDYNTIALSVYILIHLFLARSLSLDPHIDINCNWNWVMASALYL